MPAYSKFLGLKPHSSYSQNLPITAHLPLVSSWDLSDWMLDISANLQNLDVDPGCPQHSLTDATLSRKLGFHEVQPPLLAMGTGRPHCCLIWRHKWKIWHEIFTIEPCTKRCPIKKDSFTIQTYFHPWVFSEGTYQLAFMQKLMNVQLKSVMFKSLSWR